MSMTRSEARRRTPARVLETVVLAVVLMIAGVLVAQAPAAPASADPFGGCYGADSAEGCIPDNFGHWWCYDESAGQINAAFRTAITQAMTNLDTQTNYGEGFSADGCFADTDVVWQVTNISARGDYTCLARNSEGNCERARLRLNPNQLTDAANRRKTACHELGHSVGLRHGTAADNNTYTDCMRSGAITSGFNTYSSHHVTHINNRA